MSAAPVCLVGRAGQQHALDQALASIRGGGPRVALLTGEPGLGKTALAADLAARHGPATLTLTARAGPLSGHDSFGIWVEALEGELRGTDEARLRDLVGPHRGDLAGLLPSVGRLQRRGSIGQPPRARLLESLRYLLVGLSAGRPVLVVLDDMHWADGSSWDALGYLCRNLGDSPVLFVVVARSEALRGHALGAQVALGIEQDRRLTRIPVEPLGADEIAELAALFSGRGCPVELRDWLTARSAGSPLFAIGLTRALLAEGADLANPELRTLPEDLAQRVAVEVGDLTPGERELVELVAVAGTGVPVFELAQICGRDLGEAAREVDGLIRRRLLGGIDGPPGLAVELGHPLLAEAVCAGLGPARRDLLHRQIARALLAAGQHGRAAAHFLAAAVPGDVEAVDALCLTLAQTEGRELHRDSLRVLASLLEVLPAGDERWRDVEALLSPLPQWVLDHRVDVEIGAAAAATRRIDAVLGEDVDVLRRACVKLRSAVFTGWGEGDTAAGVALAEEASRLFTGAGAQAEALLCELEIGYLQWIDGRMSDLGVRAATAIAGAQELGDRRVLLEALCAQAHDRQLSGDLAGSLPVLQRAIGLARADGNVLRVSYLLAQQGWSRALLGQLEAARRDLAAGQVASAEYRASVLPDYAMQVHWLAGDLRACAAEFSEQLAWVGGHSRRRALGSSAAAVAAAELGNPDLAREIIAAASAVTSGRDTRPQSDQIRWAGGVLAASLGDRRHAADLLGSALARQGAGGWGAGPFARFMLADLAEMAVVDSDAVPTSGLLGLCEDVETFQGEAGAALDAVSTFVRGAIFLACGDAASALLPLHAAVGGFVAAQWPLFLARGQALLGAAEATLGNRDAAIESLRGAGESFERCGALVRRARVVSSLGRLGMRGSRARAELGVDRTLTGRELQVARLACGGARTKEIARRLRISERTVESHLAAVYAKFGISSRVELARFAAELSTGPA